MSLNKIKKEDIKLLKSYFEKIQPEFSQYSLSSIFLWNSCIYDVYLGFCDENLIIAEIPYENQEKRRILFPLSEKLLPVDKLYRILKKIDFKIVYYVPQSYIRENPDIEKYFEVYEQADYNDYVYKREDLQKLGGSKYSSKRNLIHQFEKIYEGMYEVKEFSIISFQDIISLVEKIKKQIVSKEKFDMYECEMMAIENIKKYIDEIEFFGICVYIGGKISAFAIGSHLNTKTCVLNFEKADKNIKGLYQFIDREFAKYVADRYIFINKESDMGKEGLKKAKLSYHPSQIIKSFVLFVKDNQ